MKYLIVWAVSCAAGAGLMHTVTVYIEKEPETAAAARYFNYEPVKDKGNATRGFTHTVPKAMRDAIAREQVRRAK